MATAEEVMADMAAMKDMIVQLQQQQQQAAIAASTTSAAAQAELHRMQVEMAATKAENDTLIKMRSHGSNDQRGLIDGKVLARLQVLENDNQWADWSTRFKDAIGARGHPAARAALDAVENLPSQSAMGDGKLQPTGSNQAAHAASQIKSPDGGYPWSLEHLGNDRWMAWARDLYYIFEDMTKGNATVIVRNSFIFGIDGIVEQDGFRAWRALKLSMNPKTPARRLRCLMEVVQCREVKDKREVNTAISNWLLQSFRSSLTRACQPAYAQYC